MRGGVEVEEREGTGGWGPEEEGGRDWRNESVVGFLLCAVR